MANIPPSLSSPQIGRLRARDRRLLSKLSTRIAKSRSIDGFRNLEVAKLVGDGGINDPHRFRKFIEIAQRQGLFELKGVRRKWKDLDGSIHTHTCLKAAETEMWPMGTHYWVRDNAIIGSRLLHSKRLRDIRLGKELLLSCLTFLSSERQLRRFREIIMSTDNKFIHDASNWPYIFAGFKNNLSTEHPEKWAHKQDAWQMVAMFILQAEEEGLIEFTALSNKHKEFLGLIVPFLAKVSFWRCENSGSWEEVPAVRSSVRAWEHRLIVKLLEKYLQEKKKYSFLERAFNKASRFLPPQFNKLSFSSAARLLDKKGCSAMLKDLPFEAPGHPKNTPCYRQADAALIYLLEIDYPAFLASRTGKSQAWALQMESELLKQVLSLEDPEIGAISRYKSDSYQRCGYFRNETSARLSEMYGGPSGDASSDMVGREIIVPRGRKAAWTHFVWQLAAWSGRKYLNSGKLKFKKLHEKTLLQGLRLITSKSWSIDIAATGESKLTPIQAWRMPECYIADRGNDGQELVFPSPHTPLNWAIGEMLAAFWVHEDVIKAD